jgi:ATP-dependent helicase YprA (DUF1998 family)
MANKLHWIRGFPFKGIMRLLQDAFGGKPPYPWQLDAAEAIVLGLECVVVAGTGAEKTIPLALPLFVHDSRNKMILVISPLYARQSDQVRAFNSFLICLTC